MVRALKSLEDGRSAGVLRIVIARWVVVVLGDGEPLDLTVIDNDCMALATSNDPDGGGPGVGHLHVELLGELGGRIAHEADVGSLDLLILAPSLHDGSVVDAVHEYLVDPGGLESVLILNKARDLSCGSGGSEGAWEADHYDFARFAKVGEADHLGRAEALVQIDCGDASPTLTMALSVARNMNLCVLILNKARDLSCGSGGSEGAWEADHYDFARFAKVGEADHLGRAEALVQIDCGDAISDFDHGSECGSKHEFVRLDSQ
eukprot:CAMPEP_0181037378 /NCGR_PEP_ID=MMETSP1070-20121207/9368_1 /TAXON_ID=265543 /ORGANISM="Minutocellus polymorphus, Strain NH13" /LENGTH=261 /DNA_ID=CAMNT_0023115087 /DNA_START=418 /DNA_END=1205 /DNA_ORIENTATION=-